MAQTSAVSRASSRPGAARERVPGVGVRVVQGVRSSCRTTAMSAIASAHTREPAGAVLPPTASSASRAPRPVACREAILGAGDRVAQPPLAQVRVVTRHGLQTSAEVLGVPGDGALEAAVEAEGGRPASRRRAFSEERCCARISAWRYRG